jgi:hypothetical protein
VNWIVTEQLRRNRQNRDTWDCFADHRRRLTEILRVTGGGRQGRLCVLGAGNCNDMDLAQLAAGFREVHLVDLDEGALRDGTERQSLAGTPRIWIHGRVDVTGSLHALAECSATAPPTCEALRQWIERLWQLPPLPLPGASDVVASICLLTQLVDAIVMAIGSRHPMFTDCVVAVRAQHLNVLLDLTVPGGKIVLVTDFVSSVTAPSLLELAEESLPQAAAEWIRERNFFTGANPYALAARLREDPFRSRVKNVTMLPPWRWDFPDRAYAVTAIVAERN